jgi:hypothetical protein
VSRRIAKLMTQNISNLKFEFSIRIPLRWVLASLLLCFLAISSSAGTLTGTVKNGTTGKPGAGVDVILIQLSAGMQPVANGKTDAQGNFKFDHADVGVSPMLVRAVYRGVNYHEPVPPGKNSVEVQIFDPTDKPSAIRITNHAVILQPNGAQLIVGEEFTIENKTQPPLAFYRNDGTFNFSIPAGAQFGQASAWGSTGMPVSQGTIDKGKNQMAIAYAFRPGESGVRFSYNIPYPGNQLSLLNFSPYAVGRLIIAAPPSVQVSGEGLSSAGQAQGFSVMTRENVAANTPVTIAVSGTAPPPTSAQGGAPAGADSAGGPGGDPTQNPGVNSRQETGGGEATATATALPARLDSLKWILVGGFVALFALGFVYLMRRPQVAVAGAPAEPAVAVSAPPPAPKAAAASVADVNRAVSGSLDELKDTLFRLELRRQAGTVSEQDYASERQRLEQVLRDLVRG